MSTKILITGGAGFIGSQLGHRLSQEGYDVSLLDDMSFGHKDNLTVDGKTFGAFVEMDIRSQEIFPHFAGVDTVFHFAGIAPLPVCQEQPYYAVSVNVAGTVNVLEAARKAGVRRVVFSSTNALYENNTQFPLTEDQAVNPHLIYPTSKLQAELSCKSYIASYGMEIVMLRFFNVYGPHQDFKRTSPPLTSYVARELVLGRAPILHSDGKQERDYVYVDDVNDIAIRAMTSDKAPGEIFNVASNTTVSVRTIYEHIARALGSDMQATYREAGHLWDKYPGLREGAHPLKEEILEKEVTKYTLGSNEKAKRLLGWEPRTSIEDGMRAVAEYAKRAMTPGLAEQFLRTNQ